MTAAGDRLAQFLDTLEKLPPFLGLTYRGCPIDAQFVRLGQLTVVTGVLSTSLNLDTATEGRMMSRLYAILSRTGRDISGFAARQADREVVLLPGTVLLIERNLTMVGLEVLLVSEVVPGREPVRAADPEVDRLVNQLEQNIASQAAEPLRPFDGIIGKFSGDIV